jgi:uncharacterized membrane protein
MERAWNLLFWLNGRLWLIPAIMSIAALGLAYVLLGPGIGVLDDLEETWWIYSGDAGTARDLLSTLLAGMITMTSLVVSITVVVLSLAANQLGPRLIYNFIEDRRIQAVIGLFVATILYTLLALRTIGDDLGAEAAVPHVAVTVASILTIACLFALLYHVNLIAHSIVSDTVVRGVANSLDRVVARLPQDLPQAANEAAETARRHRCSTSTGQSGYVQVIEYEGLQELAEKHDLLIVPHIRAGHFVLRDTDHLEVWSHEPVSDEVLDEISSSVIVGSGRTPTQDLEYSVRQLVEIALRALSPSLNDPFTAIAVINRLAAALEIVSRRHLPAREFRDGDGRLRVIADASDFEGLVDVAFNQIRQSAASSPSVLIGLAQRLSDLLHVAATSGQKQAVTKHLNMLQRAAHAIPEPNDREDLQSVIEAALSGERDAQA